MLEFSSAFAQKKSSGWTYFYPMDGNALEASPYKYHATVVGSASAETDRFGRKGKALRFDGHSGYMRCTFDANNTLPNETFSYTCWVFLENYDESEHFAPLKSSKFAPLFCKAELSDTFQYRMGFTDKGFYVDGGKENQTRGLFYSNGLTIPLKKWTMVTVASNGYVLKVYFNDRLAYSVSGSFPFIVDKNPLLIGCDKPGDDQYLNGALDDFAIYDYFLTDEYVKNIYLTQSQNAQVFNITPPPPKVVVATTNPTVDTSKTTHIEPVVKDSVEQEFHVKKGDVIVLKQVLFVQSKAELLPESYQELDKLALTMQHHPDMVIEVSGHTDNQGDRYLNIQLSKERAEVVKQYLISKGIEDKRIKCVGYGPDKPISPNHTEAMRKLNRRVEFKILKSDD